MNGTSGDVFCEYLVKSRMTGKNIGIIVLSAVLAMAITMAVFLFIPSMLIIAVAAWIGLYFMIKLQKTEYEYTYTSGDLDIDQLSGDMRRKRKVEIKGETVELIAPEKSDAMAGFANGNYKVLDYSSHDPASKNRYVIIASVNNERVRVIFEPNEKMIDNMWRYSPSKVKRV